MTQICVPIFILDHEQAKRDIARAVEAGADLVELRIDRFAEPAGVAQLVKNCIAPCIITCRSAAEGGLVERPDSDAVEAIRAADAAGAMYVDMEYETLLRVGDLPLENSRLIISSHDFSGRPDRLYNILAQMGRFNGSIHKIAWTARTVRDNLEAFEIMRSVSGSTLALCMGEAGLISRVLARKFGAPFTFAALDRTAQTAPGQPTIDDLKRICRWDSIGRGTKVFGVVGSPIAHSMSPAIHNAAFEKVGFDGVYLPFLVNPGYESFKAFMESFLAFKPLDLSGLSVTIPHKENALRYLREAGGEIDPLSERIGAVNTIAISRPPGESAPATLRGFNTDYAAILDCITDALHISRSDLAGKRIAVIGAGGAGRTAVAALAHFGATIVIYNRTFERAQALAEEFNGKTGKVVAARIEKLCDSCCELFINATSIGMHPNVGQSPLGEGVVELSPGTVVFDTVYNPMRTRLIEQAEAAGARTITGVEMFVRQAAAQFEAFANQPAPRELMRQVVEQRLSTK